MRRTAVLIATAIVLVGSLPLIGSAGALADGSAPGVAADVQSTETPAKANESLPPGARLAGAVTVQEAELEGEVDSRAFGIELARAASDRSKAAVVAGQAGALRERLAELRGRKAALREARKNGTITRPAFEAEMAGLAARTAVVRTLANRTGDAARGLPDGALREKGVDGTEIRTLRRDAANLTGPQAARIARSIAGSSVGRPIDGRGPPAGVGPGGNGPDAPAGDENVTARADRALDRVEGRVAAARTTVDRARERVGGNASENAQRRS